MEPSAKRLCIEKNQPDELDERKDSEISANTLTSYNNFKIIRILNNIEEKCSIAVEGCFGNSSEKVVAVLKKLPFGNETLNDTFSSITKLQTLFHNDIYYNQTALVSAEFNKIKIDAIYPANENHIKKYERQTSSMINETPDLYKSVTLPFISNSSYDKTWIYNVLEHKKEADRIACEDPDPEIGFVMVPDMKWTGEQMENLYLQVLVMRRDVLSIRDLRGEHVALLQNIRNKCTRAIEDKYGVPSTKLRIYFHYQPSFYHLHVHISAMSFDPPGTWAGKAHLLEDVISNLKIDPDYYMKANLSFTIKDNHPLKKLLDKKQNDTSEEENGE